jgi:hypothetical protein
VGVSGCNRIMAPTVKSPAIGVRSGDLTLSQEWREEL